jgi:hypothetical protein
MKVITYTAGKITPTEPSKQHERFYRFAFVIFKAKSFPNLVNLNSKKHALIKIYKHFNVKFFLHIHFKNKGKVEYNFYH